MKTAKPANRGLTDVPIGSREAKKKGRGGNPAENRAAAFDRRRFIYGKIRKQARLSLDEIVRYAGKTTPTQIRDDCDFFRKLGIEFTLREIDGKTVVVDEGVRYSEGQHVHRKLRIVEKKVVAKLACSLIVGLEAGNAKQRIVGSGFVSRERLLERIGNQIPAMVRQLSDYWRDNSRLVALDSASTNEQLAAQLIKLQLPTPDSNLSYLSVCTNSRTIFNAIGDPDVPIRAIITGGQQRGRSVTLAGAMTELFLQQAALLRFGISCVSAIGIDVESGYCLSETQEEMLVKQQFLTKAATRVIVVDNSKIKMQSTRQGFAFASLNPKQVDLVITNSPLSLDHFTKFCIESGRTASKDELAEQKQSIEKFSQVIKHLRKRQIGVLVARTNFTELVQVEGEPVDVEVSFSPNEMSTLPQEQ